MGSVGAKRRYADTIDLTEDEPAAKRPNVNPETTTMVSTPRPLVEEKLKALTFAEISTLLTDAAVAFPAVASMLNEVYKGKVEAQSSRVLNFDSDSKSVWRTLQSHARESGSRQYDAAGDVCNEIIETIEDVVRRATPRAITSNATRRNAMEALRRIGKTIALGQSDALSHEVHKWFQQNDELGDGMLQIVHDMSYDEREEIYTKWKNDKGELFGVKLRELVVLASGVFIFEGLEKVVALLAGEQSEEDDSNQSTGEEDESDDGS